MRESPHQPAPGDGEQTCHLYRNAIKHIIPTDNAGRFFSLFRVNSA